MSAPVPSPVTSEWGAVHAMDSREGPDAGSVLRRGRRPWEGGVLPSKLAQWLARLYQWFSIVLSLASLTSAQRRDVRRRL